MKKTNFGFTYAENDEEKAKLILDAIEEGDTKDVKYCVMFKPLNIWVNTTDRLHITVGDLSKLKVSRYDSEDGSGSIYLEKEDDPIDD